MAKRRRIEKDEDGNKWEVRETTDSEGRLVTTHRLVQPKSEVNQQRAKAVIRPDLRHLLEKQEALSMIMPVGKLLLEAERRRGKRPPKVPVWWIYEKHKQLQERERKGWTRIRIAEELTLAARKEWGLSEDESITEDDVKNAQKAMRKR
jgi:hypothetical protein